MICGHFVAQNIYHGIKDGVMVTIKKNRPGSEKGFDVNRWTWNRKVKNWKQPFNIVLLAIG